MHTACGDTCMLHVGYMHAVEIINLSGCTDFLHSLDQLVNNVYTC